jgi:hypothetical protein
MVAASASCRINQPLLNRGQMICRFLFGAYTKQREGAFGFSVATIQLVDDEIIVEQLTNGEGRQASPAFGSGTNAVWKTAGNHTSHLRRLSIPSCRFHYLWSLSAKVDINLAIHRRLVCIAFSAFLPCLSLQEQQRPFMSALFGSVCVPESIRSSHALKRSFERRY